MKKLMLSFFFLLLLFAAATTTATAQAANPKLAVLVVGMDDWMLGDVLAHLVGEELKRVENYAVVTRESYVQNKLKALRRGYDELNDYHLRMWATGEGINTLCLVTTTSGLNFSLRLLDVLSGEVQFGWSRVEPNAVALKELAWSLTGSIGNSCTPFGSLGSYTDPLIGMEMVYVEGGEFTMGCLATREDFDDCDDAEKPANSVTVSSFWIGKYEVTQGQWEAVMGNTIQEQRDNLGSASHYPLHGVGAHTPMYYVSWNEAKAFCDTLSARTGWSYRLATEKEWEYAARGGNRSRGYVYSGSNTVDSVAWYYFNSGTNRDNNNPHAHAVGTTTKRGNELGIYDMSGNVWEWCSSGWRANYSYNDASEDDSYRVLRGGCWNDGKLNSRVAYRLHYAPGTYSYTFGFRVV